MKRNNFHPLTKFKPKRIYNINSPDTRKYTHIQKKTNFGKSKHNREALFGFGLSLCLYSAPRVAQIF